MLAPLLSGLFFCLELALVPLVLGRRFRGQLVSFTAFIILLAARDTVSWIFVPSSLRNSVAWFDIYWTTEFILSAMYLVVIAEIAKRSLSGYPSIWRPASTLLSAVALGLVSWTVASTLPLFGHRRLFVMVGDRCLVLTITILVLLLMAIDAYYRLKLPSLYRLVLVGIGIYSSVEVVANQFQIQSRVVGFWIWGEMRVLSFGAATIVWIYAIWRWAGPSARQAELIPQSKYEALSPKIHDRLREAIRKLATLAGERS
jgi:hypothetical protein